MFGLMFIYAIYVRVSIGDFDFFLYPFFYIYKFDRTSKDIFVHIMNLNKETKCKQEAV